MEIKVLCGCGAKFAFDVEPVNGRMPVVIYCPKCSADVTAFANGIISEKLAATAVAPVPQAFPVGTVPQAKPRLKVAGGHEAVATPQSVDAAEATPPATTCNRHIRSAATGNCFICQKPICSECMGQFGYLCSVICKYQAEQRGIRVPQYEFQKTAVENRWWKKAGQISGLIGVIVLFLLLAVAWFLYSGSQPKEFYSLKFSGGKGPLHTEFLSKGELLLLFPDKITLHDISKKKDVWSTALTETAEPAKKDDEDTVEDNDRPDFDRWGAEPQMHLTKDAVWMALPKQVLALDLKTGSKKQTIGLPGELIRFSTSDEAVFVTCTTETRRRTITKIDLSSGATKTQEIIPTPVEKQFVVEELSEGFTPTAAFLLETELASDDQRKRALKTVYSRFISAGANVIEMQVRMVQPNVVNVASMKTPGPSALNTTTSASTSAGLVAEEIFNDLKRSKTGGFKRVDESTYRVTLRRILQDAEPWSGDVTGPPALFPMKTVDVLVAGKMAYVFDKLNKKLFEAKLTFPAAKWLMDSSGESPFIEVDKSLYFFDQGILTAFDLPSGNVQWRYPSVGITRIQPDGKGHLYVSSTTASPEDIQYSDEIKMQDKVQPVLQKVQLKNGEKLWESFNLLDCELSGKYLYAMNLQSGGLGLAVGLSEALGSSASTGGGGHFRVYRVDPDSGNRKWEYYSSSPPFEMDFEGNRILLNFGNEVRLLKYITF